MEPGKDDRNGRIFAISANNLDISEDKQVLFMFFIVMDIVMVIIIVMIIIIVLLLLEYGHELMISKLKTSACRM